MADVAASAVVEVLAVAVASTDAVALDAVEVLAAVLDLVLV